MKIWLNKVNEILDQQTQETTVVVDFQESSFIPNDALSHIQNILENRHPKADPIILTGLSNSHRAVLATLFKLHPHVATPLVIMDNIYELIS